MRKRERERDEYRAVRRRKERNPMSVNVYRTKIPTKESDKQDGTVIVFHDSVHSSTLVRVERDEYDEERVTIINNVSNDNLPGYLNELQATLWAGQGYSGDSSAAFYKF